jgi:hypothetical protein
MTLILTSFIIICQVLLSTLFYHSKLNIYYAIGGYTIFTVLIVSYSLTVFSNPGIPDKSKNFLSKEKQQNIRISRLSDGFLTCNVCNVFVNNDVKIGHCLSCKICIIGYDHHCGWSSKCIGKGNLKSFWVFFISTILFLVYNLVGLLLSNILESFNK